MTWELRVALRYLVAKRKQAFISVISGVAVLGVTIGVAAVLIALGLMTGLQSEIRARILGATAHVSVFPARGEPFEDEESVIRKVRGVPGVAGAAPALYGKALLTERRRGGGGHPQGHRAGGRAHGHGRDLEAAGGGRLRPVRPRRGAGSGPARRRAGPRPPRRSG